MQQSNHDNCKIVAAYAGAGKSTLASLHPDTFIDFVSMPFKYHLPPNSDNSDIEANKANYDLAMNFDWPQNYVAAIIEAMKRNTGKVLLIPPDSWVLELLREASIPYILCYPCREAKEEYHRRFIERGNNEDFIEVFIGCWDIILDRLEWDEYATSIVMKSEKYLSDLIHEIAK